jgi:hypothetical protein
MHWTLRRAAVLVASCVAALAASAASASAAGTPIVTTGQATNVTATTAILNGTVTANGSTTAWQFSYGHSASSLALAPKPAGTIGATGVNVPVSVEVTGLLPATTYSFTLFASNATNVSKYPYYGLFTPGKTMSFTTKGTAPPPRGRLILTSRSVRVHHHHAAISLRCASVRTCAGRVTITGRAKFSRHGKKHKFACVARRRFVVRAHKAKTIHVLTTRRCGVALRFARHHRFKGKLTATTHTGQPRLKKTVTVHR